MYNVAHAQIELAHFETTYDLFLLILINNILIIIIYSWDNISENSGVGDPKSPSLHKTTKKNNLKKTISINFIRTSEDSQSL